MKNIFKLILLTLHILCCVQQSQAQTPPKFNFQAVLRDANGNALSNQQITNGVIVKIYDNVAGAGSVYYQEDFNPVTTNLYGVINLQIGTNPGFGNLATLNWATKSFYIDIWMNGSSIYNGTNLSQLVSVPYALHASHTDTAQYASNAPQTIYTAGSGIGVTSNVISNTQPDQIVTLTSSGISTVSGSYPNFAITSTEVDGSTTNELQTLSNATGNIISLSSGGGSVTLNFTVANNQLQLNGTNVLPLSSLIPAGTIMAYGGTTIPNGWLLCDGALVISTTYPNLFAAIDHNFGGSGGNFNLPDLRGRFLRGVDGLANNDPDKTSRTAMALYGQTGNNVGSVQADEVASHSHNFPHNLVAGYYVGSGWGIGNGSNNPIYGSDSGTLSSGGNETRPKNVYVNYIIKY
ncbi:MAG: tail fiber protein [Chitinophagaceae bacterium]|nr:tail fiber protein [Chitinophagaceae bacterium]